MSSYQHPTGDDDPIHIVRTIGRLAQMVLEIRDEYIEGRRDDALDQLERRLDEISGLRDQLRTLRASQDAAGSAN
ncbi:MAG TPA: hypothetical protein VEX37_10500 [Thermomicrobiales bacterium]|nr:hypothetical protein [Thermomicrobiales bacterium]